ncbi:PREDICTED: uncharacterized protein LOC104743591 [Camelina sativa]|uniref:Uncharacterized protein LOC104743591 n=1 Tax=Camelina sativa TaxID=90675 RepID=A0ABM0VY91_CAMSA|nr:PREDICTED: uncharacterized protein LOC104743591 [Camelina sativa]
MSSDSVEEPARSHWNHRHVKVNKNTGVFWDVVDFPIPTAECDPDLISKKIKSALAEKGCYNGPLSISLYDTEDEKTLLPPSTKQELIDRYEAAGVSLNFVPKEEHGYERVYKMLVDILLWAVNSPACSNLIILSKGAIKEERTLEIIESLYFGSFDAKVVLPERTSELMPFTESSAWLWELLCDGGGSSQSCADTDAVGPSED